ncbi:MAG: translation initiation factor IF-2 [bacterium]
MREKQVLEELRRNKARMELEERIRFATQLAEQRPHRLRKAKEEEQKRLDEQERKASELAHLSPETLAKKELADKELTGDVPATRLPVSDQEKEPPQEELSVVELISKAKKEIDQQKKAEAKKEDGKPGTKKKVEEKPKDAEAKPDQTTTISAAAETKAKDKISPEAAAAEKAVPTESGPKRGEKAVADETGVKPKPEAQEDKTKRKGKGKKKRKRKISEEEIQESIKQTLAAMDEVKPKRRRKRTRDSGVEAPEDQDSIIKVSEFISVAELADLLGIDAGQVITKCLELGVMVSINQRLTIDTIEAVADEFGFVTEKIEEYGAEIIDRYGDTDDDLAAAVTRPPVVTIMGHVDHGKTSLLDFVRNSSIISGESGGITQHIGAYEVSVNGKEITFLDTPGHEAFTAMRARGAQATDLVVLIVAADDGVQPQTIEAISHALAAHVPIVVAINKIDKPSANPDVIKKQLAEHNILIEEWGGKYQCVEMSAKTGQGVDRLLDLILLEAEVLELKANRDRTARGVIIEAKLDKGKGAVGTVLVQSGTLRVGNLFVAGHRSGKVRAMYDERSRKVSAAPPSTPVQVIGFDGVPQAGDNFVVLTTEREVREISTKRQQLRREQEFRTQRHLTLDQIAEQIQQGKIKELNIILKADVDGSIEALSDALMKLSNAEVSVKVIHKAVGGISESDILLASASNAIIIGFHVRPTIQARELAKQEEIDIRLYDIIYSAVEEVKAALEGMLDPEITEELTSTIEVRETFKVPKIGTIAGSYVVSGKASRNDFTRVYRNDKLIQETKISSLKRFKEDVREVSSGFECGINLDDFDDIKVGDIIETYRKVETARTL